MYLQVQAILCRSARTITQVTTLLLKMLIPTHDLVSGTDTISATSNGATPATLANGEWGYAVAGVASWPLQLQRRN